MKNSIQLTLAILATFFLFTCDDGIEEVTAQNTLEPVVVEASQTTVIDLLANQALPENPALTIVWQEADYDVPTTINYEVQLSSTQDFAEPLSVATVNDRNYTWTVEDLNIDAQRAGLTVEVEQVLYVRVISSIGDRNNPALQTVSNVTSVNVIPYFAYLFKDFYLVGNATAPNWNNNNNNPPLFRSEEDENVYTYTGFFTGNQFKLLEVLGQWQPQWGTNDGASMDGNPATQDGDPDVFQVPGSDGLYVFTANFSNRTFRIDEYEGAPAVTYSSITLDGSAGNVSLTQLSFDNNIWYANGVDLSSGTAQFVTNTGATWGGLNEFNGRATEGSLQIPVTERNYNVWFNGLTGEYMLIPTF